MFIVEGVCMKDIICDEILQCIDLYWYTLKQRQLLIVLNVLQLELLHLHNSCYSHIMVLHPVRDSLSKAQMHEY